MFLIARGNRVSDSVSAAPAAASRSQRAAAPKAARRNKARREIRLSHGGVPIADVAPREGEKRMRARRQENLARRLPEAARRKILALLACDGARAKASVEAIDRVVTIAREFDRTRGFAAGMHRSSPAAKGASQILRTARLMLSSSEFLKRGRPCSRRRGEEKKFCWPRARRPLISLDSAPEMEGNGNIWKGLSGLRCARSRFDCARLRIGGVFWKKMASTLPKPVDRRTNGMGTRRCRAARRCVGR